MSPHKVLVVKRWQVGLAFLAVTLAFVYATHKATEASNSARATAQQAHTLAIQNRTTIQRSNQIRADLISRIHQQDVANCRRVRVENHVLRDAIRRGIRQTQAQLRSPNVNDGLAQLLRHSIVESHRFLRNLRTADCRDVPPLKATP